MNQPRLNYKNRAWGNILKEYLNAIVSLGAIEI